MGEGGGGVIAVRALEAVRWLRLPGGRSSGEGGRGGGERGGGVVVVRCALLGYDR